MNARALAVRVADGFQYAAVLNAALVIVAGAASYAVTGRLVGLKWTLFLAGIVLVALGTLTLRPRAAWSDDEGSAALADGDPGDGVADDSPEGGFGRRVGRLPLVGWFDHGPTARASIGARFLLAGALALVLSFALEATLGVGVPTVS